MKQSTVASLAALLLSTTPLMVGAGAANANEGSVALGLHGGTLGLGANAEFGISEQFSARAMFSQLGLSYEETESGNQYDGDLDLQSIGLMTDWRPFSAGLRLTGGVFVNNNEVSATARSTSLDIGGNPYDASLRMLLDFEPIAPYLGAGWSSGYGEPGLGFAFDAGLLYQRSPRISATGTSPLCSFVLSEDGNATVSGTGCDPRLRADLESEHADLSDALDSFKWYPVVSLGVSYGF